MWLWACSYLLLVDGLVVRVLGLWNINQNRLMKKVSLATTVDGDPRRTPRKALEHRPLLVGDCYTQLHTRNNWVYRCLGILYISSGLSSRPHLEDLLVKLSSEDIPFPKYKNIPFSCRKITDMGRLVQQLENSFKVAEEILGKSKDKTQGSEGMLRWLEGDEISDFSVVTLMRSLVAWETERLLKGREREFLGNEREVIENYAVDPAYKALELVCEALGYSVRIDDKDQPKTSKIYNQTVAGREISIIRTQGRLFFAHPHSQQSQSQPPLQQVMFPEPLSVNLNPLQLRLRGNPLHRPFRPHNHSPQSSPFHHSPQSHDPSSDLNSTTRSALQSSTTHRVKICVNCGEARKPQQKFCDCRKKKILSSKLIPVSNQ